MATIYNVIYVNEKRLLLMNIPPDHSSAEPWPAGAWQVACTPPVHSKAEAAQWCDDHGYPDGAWSKLDLSDSARLHRLVGYVSANGEMPESDMDLPDEEGADAPEHWMDMVLRLAKRGVLHG